MNECDCFLKLNHLHWMGGSCIKILELRGRLRKVNNGSKESLRMQMTLPPYILLFISPSSGRHYHILTTPYSSPLTPLFP